MELSQPCHTRLLVGLGNPGSRYEWTRHNLGCHAVELFAKKHHSCFCLERKFLGKLAKIQKLHSTIYLLLPTTYMNASGQAVKKIIDFFNLSFSDVLIVADDLSLPFSSMRLRLHGSSGGHNGLKDIERSLHSKQYARLRLGIDAPTYEPVEEYVLNKFSLQEQHKLPDILHCAVAAMDIWLTEENKEKAMSQINCPNFYSKISNFG